MKAVRVDGPGGVELAELPRPRPGDGEVLVRVTTAALCSTDRKLAAKGGPAPRVLGHELAGELADGAPVGVHPDVGCGRCEQCRAGRENRCPQRTSVGIDRDGGLAEWVSVPRRHVLPLDGVPVGLGPLLEPLACCLHAVAQLDVRAGDRAVVVGAGAMGILASWALQATGARVGVCQRSTPRRRLAAELGADAVFGPDDDVVRALGARPDAVIVTAPGAEALEWALREAAVGGRVHAFAGTPGGAPVDANAVHYRHLTLVGSTGSTVGDYRRAVALAASGTVDLARLPRSVVALADVPGLLASEPDAEVLKVVVDVDGGGDAR